MILIPEIPYDMDVVCRKIQQRYESGRNFAIVVVAEGAFPQGGEPVFKQAGFGPVKLEGLPAGDWVLLDAGDIIVHLFRPEVRAFYNLEKMWTAELPDGDETTAATA